MALPGLVSYSAQSPPSPPLPKRGKEPMAKKGKCKVKTHQNDSGKKSLGALTFGAVPFLLSSSQGPKMSSAFWRCATWGSGKAYPVSRWRIPAYDLSTFAVHIPRRPCLPLKQHPCAVMLEWFGERDHARWAHVDGGLELGWEGQRTSGVAHAHDSLGHPFTAF